MLDTPYAPSGPHPGNGVTTTFPFAFKIWALADLRVVRITNATGLEEVLTAGIDYTVPAGAIGAAAGGTITLAAGPLSSAYSLRLESDLQPVQTARYGNQGAIAPESVEASLDKLTRLVQQLAAVLGARAESAAVAADVNALVAGLGTGTPARYTLATRPAASALWRGVTLSIKDAGVDEEFHQCRLKADGVSYEWVVLTPAGGA